MRKRPLRSWGDFTLLLVVLHIVAVVYPVSHAADPKGFSQRKDVQAFIKQVSQRYKLSPSYIQETLSEAKIRPRVSASVSASRTVDWPRYQKLFLTPKRIQEGAAFWQAHKVSLASAEKRYGIPQEIIVAILGVETNYGDKQGEFRVIDSLATLGFGYRSRRARFFKEELAHFLALCQEQHWQPHQIYGSYAGAIGQPQFMPSSYRKYAVDFSGDGKKDLRNNTLDAIGSVAHFLQTHGWQAEQGIVEQADYSGKGIYQVMARKNAAAFSLEKIHKSGIKTHHSDGANKGNLIGYQGKRRKEYWLAYPNFFVITRYNISRHYALTVYLLAQQIKSQLSQPVAKT